MSELGISGAGYLPRFVRFRFSRPGLLILTALMAAACLVDPAQAPAQGFVPAKSARAFGDSVGVNVRLTHIDTTAYHDLPAVEARIRELGVRYVNDSLCPTCTYQVASLQRLGAAGIRANLGFGSLAGGTGAIAPGLQAVRTRLRSSIASFAGVNEPDVSGLPDWVARTRAYQAELARQVKADPFLSRFPVIGPSLVNRGSRAALGDMTAWVDRGNIHPYSGGNPPLRNLLDEQQLMSAVSGSKPLVITEVGFHNDLAFNGPHRPASLRATAIYTPRIALEAFRFGIERTYFYQLADYWRPSEAAAHGMSPSENSFGLLAADLSRKPSFVALRNLLRVVDGDSAPVADPGGLRYALNGAGPDVRQLLLRSADGSYALVLWRDVSVWDRDALRDLTPAPEAVQVALGQRIASARSFDPVSSDMATASWTDPQRIPVELGGAPVVLRLAPPGTPAAGGVKKALKVGTRSVRCGGKLKAHGSKKKRAQRRRARAGCCEAVRHLHVRDSKRKHRRHHHARKRPRASWSAACSSVKHRHHK